MKVTVGLKLLPILGVCIGHQILAQATVPLSASRNLSPGQLLQTNELTPIELAYYNQHADPDSRKAFLITRSWEQLCQEVVDKRLPAIQLPKEPAEFNVRYLLPAEDVVINRAIAAGIIAEACVGNPAACNNQRGVVEMEASQMLTPAQLTPQELDYYSKLTDPDTKNRFIRTRSYVRLCQQVVDHSMPAAQLPDEPLGFTRSFLLPGEEDMVKNAGIASLAALCDAHSRNCLALPSQ